jgi:hypothetical protein
VYCILEHIIANFVHTSNIQRLFPLSFMNVLKRMQTVYFTTRVKWMKLHCIIVLVRMAIEGSSTKRMWFHSNKLLQNGQKHDQKLTYSHNMTWINFCCNTVTNHLGHTNLPPIHWAIIYIHIHTWNKSWARTEATQFLHQTLKVNRTNICLTAPQHNTFHVSRPTL